MSWKTLFISNPCKISIEKSNLLIKTKEQKRVVTIKDISTIVLETNQATITSKALSLISENNIILIGMDRYRMPNSLTLPLGSHSLFSKIVHAQKDMSEPFKKRLWQKLIISKVENQAEVLKIFEKQEYRRVYKLSKDVLSGDSTNIEAQASRVYWSALFDDFIREGEGAIDLRNSALNYGYAIIRSTVARSMVAVGLFPAFGVFHKNYFNAFNFVDDVMEPYRAFVDFHIKTLIEEGREEFLTTSLKADIIDILNREYVYMDSGISSIKTAIHQTMLSIQKSILEKELNLKLPKLKSEVLERYFECI